jgi:hypothetical protein
MLAFLLYLIAFICFVLAALGVGTRVNLLAAGLACWVLTAVIAAWPS